MRVGPLKVSDEADHFCQFALPAQVATDTPNIPIFSCAKMPSRTESALLEFRDLVERHQLIEAIFTKTDQYLPETGLVMRPGKMSDAPTIHAPSSTK